MRKVTNETTVRASVTRMIWLLRCIAAALAETGVVLVTIALLLPARLFILMMREIRCLDQVNRRGIRRVLVCEWMLGIQTEIVAGKSNPMRDDRFGWFELI